MQFKELKDNVSMMFQQQKGEEDTAYEFYLREALKQFANRPGDLTAVWNEIKAYDANKNRAPFAFFMGIAAGTKIPGSDGFLYYQCKCSEKLSVSSNGGCVKCRKPGAELKRVKEPITVTRCQDPCFDCSIYSDKQMGPTCDKFGTPGYIDCKYKNNCNCQACCRFEWKRTYHPDKLRNDYPAILQTLPKPISAAGLAFHEGRVDFLDIKKLLTKRGRR